MGVSNIFQNFLYFLIDGVKLLSIVRLRKLADEVQIVVHESEISFLLLMLHTVIGILI